MPTFSQNIVRTRDGETPVAIGNQWLGRMTAAIRDAGADQPITLGCFPWTSCAGLNPTQQAVHLDILSPHVYPKDCSRRSHNPWTGVTETDNQLLLRCSANANNIGTGEIAVEFNGTLVWTRPDGTTQQHVLTGSGDGLTFDLDRLTQWAAPGKPVIVGETSTHTGGDVPRLMRETLADGRTDGWLAIFGDGVSLSEQRVENVFPYINARMIQRLVRERAPCGNCGP